ncbi:MAG: class I SAM-dependent methyltransferase [Candidatus Schekmanbacteria bacterium]|nr:class I SAM-dependent methyltransferase [Candidatus Schekmanbacteria bacterium]
MDGNHNKLSAFSHRLRVINAPASDARVAHLLELLDLAAAASIVDLGCGTGEWLIRAVAGSACRGVGVDIDDQALAEARRRALVRGVENRIEWRAEGASEVCRGAGRRFDRALCVGASHAFGGYLPALAALVSCTAPGGRVLVGEGFWHRPPSAEYVAFLGGGDELRAHEENVWLAERAGLLPLFAGTATLDEWDDFEWAFWRAVATCPGGGGSDDEELRALRERRKQWRDGYLRWGRGTMGFGYYVFGVE